MSAAVPSEICVSLVEEAPVGICVLQDACIVYGNRWMREFSGYAPDEAHPLEAFTVIHPEDRALVGRQMELRLAGREARPSYPVRFVTRNGEVRQAEFFATSIRFQGRPAIQATLIDITARVDAEQKLQKYAARLEESNRFRLLFGDIVSHDLMSPVWVAENYMRLVMDGGVPESKRPFFEGIRNSLAKARAILTDARSYLRIQDRVPVGGESVALAPLVEEVAKSLRPLWEEKGQEVTFSLAPGAAIEAGLLVKEVAWHLLSNAVKYGAPGSPIEVVVRANPRVRLEVHDRGPGVPAQDRERIFQRFERMEKGAIVGVGLGLAIVRRIVDMYGGEVWVEGNPGGGSIFIAEFPGPAGS